MDSVTVGRGGWGLPLGTRYYRDETGRLLRSRPEGSPRPREWSSEGRLVCALEDTCRYRDSETGGEETWETAKKGVGPVAGTRTSSEGS